jgi:hypothetical protein
MKSGLAPSNKPTGSNVCVSRHIIVSTHSLEFERWRNVVMERCTCILTCVFVRVTERDHQNVCCMIAIVPVMSYRLETLLLTRSGMDTFFPFSVSCR